MKQEEKSLFIRCRASFGFPAAGCCWSLMRRRATCAGSARCVRSRPPTLWFSPAAAQAVCSTSTRTASRGGSAPRSAQVSNRPWMWLQLPPPALCPINTVTGQHSVPSTQSLVSSLSHQHSHWSALCPINTVTGQLSVPSKQSLVMSLFGLRHKPGRHHNLWTLQAEAAPEHRQLQHPGAVQDPRASE